MLRDEQEQPEHEAGRGAGAADDDHHIERTFAFADDAGIDHADDRHEQRHERRPRRHPHEAYDKHRQYASLNIHRRIDSGSATATTTPRAVTTPSALTSTCTVTLRPAIPVGRATSSSSGPCGVGFRKSTCSDAVT